MITISTYDLVGATKDVLGFAPSARSARDMAYLRFTCNGETLQISTYADTHAAVSTWTPPPTPGGIDDPWEAMLRTRDAKDLVDNFKLTGARETETALTVEYIRGELVVTRQAVDDDKIGVSFKRTRYATELDAIVPKAADKFGDLGAYAPGRKLLVADPVLVPLGKAAKRTGEPALMAQFERGVRAFVGQELAVMWAYPLEVDRDEVDAQAIVDEAVAAL